MAEERKQNEDATPGVRHLNPDGSTPNTEERKPPQVIAPVKPTQQYVDGLLRALEHGEELKEIRDDYTQALRDQLVFVQEESSEWREEAWQCYVESGADPGQADARHLNLGEAVGAVKEARELAEEADKEHEEAERKLARATRALIVVRDHTPDKSPSFDPYAVVRRVARLALEHLEETPDTEENR